MRCSFMSHVLRVWVVESLSSIANLEYIQKSRKRKKGKKEKQILIISGEVKEKLARKTRRRRRNSRKLGQKRPDAQLLLYVHRNLIHQCLNCNLLILICRLAKDLLIYTFGQVRKILEKMLQCLVFFYSCFIHCYDCFSYWETTVPCCHHWASKATWISTGECAKRIVSMDIRREEKSQS